MEFLDFSMKLNWSLKWNLTGTSIDQGIAYVLMMVALALTYLIHNADLSNSF